MTAYIVEKLGLSHDEANRLRTDYTSRYGAVLLGLIRHHAIDPHEFLARVHATFDAMTHYRMKLNFFQKQGSQTSAGVYDMQGSQPRTLVINILQGNSSGTKLLWKGGSTCKVRPTGFLSALTVDLAISDERVVSVRGYTLAQTDIPAMYKLLDAPGNHAVLVAPGVVEVTGSGLLKGIVKMRGTFNAATAIPTRIEMWDAKESVVRMTIDGLRPVSSINEQI